MLNVLHLAAASPKRCDCVMTLWPAALKAARQLLLSPVAPIRAQEWECVWITHLYPLKTSDGGGGSWKAIDQSEQMVFQPWHVTRISPVVILTSSLLSPSHTAHMPSIPRGDMITEASEDGECSNAS